MASGFFALFDDIASLMDDVAVMTKVSAQKTAGILGDDLAVNANKASGFKPSRELPVLWAITKGSFVNKLIILPFIFLLNYFLPQIITPILMLGGIYLAYEGAEKIYEFFFHQTSHSKKDNSDEKTKIRSAITTDFILSLEIVIIALSTVPNATFLEQVITVTIVAFLATIGVYGIVALIVRLDDIGLAMKRGRESGFLHSFGGFLITLLPKLVRTLSVVGTFAMLMVAGGIYMHNLHYLHELLHFIPSLIAELVVGFVLGVVALVIILPIQKLLLKNT